MVTRELVSAFSPTDILGAALWLSSSDYDCPSSGQCLERDRLAAGDLDTFIRALEKFGWVTAVAEYVWARLKAS